MNIVNKHFKLLSLVILIFSVCILTANAEVWLNEDGDYQTDADKFVSQKKVKVKTSFLADKMENATRKATNKGGYEPDEDNNNNNNEKKSTNTNYRKTYKWF